MKGRFAPSPSGRMHLGNIFTAVLSWLSVKSRGGSWVLRIEDLDRQRSRREYAEQIEDDLRWLGLDWDEGGLEGRGPAGPYLQSLRDAVYEARFAQLREAGMLYRCRCTKSDIMATQAPHESDGRVVYSGKCRPADEPPFAAPDEGKGAWRLYVPDREIVFNDAVYGERRVNLQRHCGDFIVRRADGAWAYQLAVVADDSAMGITEVMRGCDLLLSSAQQKWLYELFGEHVPEFAHVPLICNAEGLRLSKRDASLSMQELRRVFTPEDLLGRIGALAGIIDRMEPCTLAELLAEWPAYSVPAMERLKV